MAGEFEAIGFDALDKMLKVLPAKVGKKIAKKAMRAALKPVLKGARNNAPVKSGRLRKAIKIVTGRIRKGLVSMFVGTKDGAFKGDEFYTGFQELGWKTGSRKGGGSRTQVEGEHFIKDAFEDNENKMLTILENELGKLIEAEAKK
jgi:HK97 gp10 family phage protein